MSLSITSHFDAGAIEVVSCETADDIRLRIRADNRAAFAQWFYFRLSGARGQRCRCETAACAWCECQCIRITQGAKCLDVGRG